MNQCNAIGYIPHGTIYQTRKIEIDGQTQTVCKHHYNAIANDMLDDCLYNSQDMYLTAWDNLPIAQEGEK